MVSINVIFNQHFFLNEKENEKLINKSRGALTMQCRLQNVLRLEKWVLNQFLKPGEVR